LEEETAKPKSRNARKTASQAKKQCEVDLKYNVVNPKSICSPSCTCTSSISLRRRVIDENYLDYQNYPEIPHIPEENKGQFKRNRNRPGALKKSELVQVDEVIDMKRDAIVDMKRDEIIDMKSDDVKFHELKIDMIDNMIDNMKPNELKIGMIDNMKPNELKIGMSDDNINEQTIEMGRSVQPLGDVAEQPVRDPPSPSRRHTFPSAAGAVGSGEQSKPPLMRCVPKPRCDTPETLMPLATVEPESINKVESTGGWVEVMMAVDSGATETVMNEDHLDVVETVEGRACKRGVKYEVANGVRIDNLGEKKFTGVTAEGAKRQIVAQICDVNKALLSVRKVVAAGNRVVFDDVSFIEDKDTKKRIYLEDQGGMYVLKLWVKSDDDF